jgi:hypothetical protein
MQVITGWSKSLRAEGRGEDVVGHASNVILRMLADSTGLSSRLSLAFSRPEPIHDKGAVMRDVAVSIAGSAHNLAGPVVPRGQQRLFEEVASVPTMWRNGINETPFPTPSCGADTLLAHRVR